MSVETRRAERQPKSETQAMLEADKTKEGLKQAADIATDFIPGVSETKDIISLGQNIGKGDYVGAGIDATSLALGAVPIVGDIARRGFKTLFAQDIKNATELLKDDKLIDKWKKDNPNPKPQKRNPDVQKAANELLDGKITGKQYRSIVKENMPIKKINEVPEIPTFTEIVGSLTSDKSKKGILGLNKEIKDGTRVASRLDIPAYENHDKWIVSVHDAKNKKGIEGLDGDIIGYGKTAVLKNVEFKSSPASAAKISAKRASKGTIARIFGDYVNADPEDVASSAQKFLNDPEWTQVGYNPFRQGFFYNKDTGMPIKSAEEVLQVGPLVLAKNAKKFTISEAKKVGPRGGLKIRTPGKTQVVFNEGGTNMKKNVEAQQLEMFGDMGMAKSPAKKDPISGNEIPKASTAEEVRDDIPARLSEGEFVLPADVVRYHGLEKLMKLRQQAKQGINMMDDMGQLGNSEQATMPDDLPFTPNKMQEGGVVQPQVNQQNTVPGVKFTAPQAQTLRPSVYTQPAMQPVVQKAPEVSVPTQPTYTTQVLRQTPKRTDTASTPTFKSLIGAPFGQLQKSETKKYVNEETGEELYIPFVNGQPVYPIPEGYKFEGDIKKEEEEKEPVKATVDTARVTQDAGDDGGFTTPDTPEYRVASTLASQKGGKISSIVDKVFKAGPIGVVTDFLDDKFGTPKDAAGERFSSVAGMFPTELDQAPSLEAAQEAQLEALSQQSTGLSYSALTEKLGVKPSFLPGTKPGDISRQTGKFFNEYGQSENVSTGDVAYSSFSDFVNAMSASAKSGYYGGIESAKAALAKDPNNQKAKNFLTEMNVKYKDKDDDDDDKKPDDKPTVTTTPSSLDPTGMDFGVKDPTTFSPDVGDRPSVQTQPDPIDYSPPSTVGDPSYSTPSNVASASSFGDEPGDDTDSSPSGDPGGGFGGSSAGDFGFTATGGLMNKKKIIMKKKPKPKNMKRGGLASRK